MVPPKTPLIIYYEWGFFIPDLNIQTILNIQAICLNKKASIKSMLAFSCSSAQLDIISI
jgi:hypothetical protein